MRHRISIRGSVHPSIGPLVQYACSKITQMTHQVARLGLFHSVLDSFFPDNDQQDVHYAVPFTLEYLKMPCFWTFWAHCPCPNAPVTFSITAPAHPNANGVAVCPALFILEPFNSWALFISFDSQVAICDSPIGPSTSSILSVTLTDWQHSVSMQYKAGEW